MEAALSFPPPNRTAPHHLYSKGHKRMKVYDDARDCITGTPNSAVGKSTGGNRQNVVDFSNPCAFSEVVDELDAGKYGSVTEEIESLIQKKTQLIGPLLAKYPELRKPLLANENVLTKDGFRVRDTVIVLPDDCADKSAPKPQQAVIVIDSDDEDKKEEKEERRLPHLFQEIILPRPILPLPLLSEEELNNRGEDKYLRDTPRGKRLRELTRPLAEVNGKKDGGVYIGVQDDLEPQNEDDGLTDIWNEMSLALECTKDVTEYPSLVGEKQEDDYCDHSFVMKDDLGYVCRVCGVIQRPIETIIEVQYKAKKSTRTYAYESRNFKDGDKGEKVDIEIAVDGRVVNDISAHPRHTKQMKPHQLEGFNFLCSNLIGENPGGCILAHAPGSGKTFMIISFMQSFLAKDPDARPLVVLPKGILPTWRREFETWQVEDVPLLDFYSVKADSRSQQLEVLEQWMEHKSILFLGYKQFSTIICDDVHKDADRCQKILLNRPSLLILDEGHTPRNDSTDVLQSLAKIQTPRKVVLSGTLYQNHVKEVFNILNLVRPKFLKLDTSRALVNRIMSRVEFHGARKQVKQEAFYDLVEHTIQKDADFKRKVAVIQDLRQMTSKVLHYYKGDFLDELPGLVDFTVMLNLSRKQKQDLKGLRQYNWKFKKTAVGCALYLHPKLLAFSDNVNATVTDPMMDELLESLDVRDGVKAKFFLNLLNLCESSAEKLLVFSQYLTPLKFLERLAVKVKGWIAGKEIFVISGDSTSDRREWSMERFNNSADAKVFFGSIKACGEGISLVGASRIIILDVHLNPSVTRQAIGRAFRPGQTKKVYVYRLVAANTLEEEDHSACFRKEAIAKMWFEWNEYCGYQKFEVETVDINDCGDMFLESPLLKEDVKSLHKR